MISVIIPTRNKATLLDKALHSVIYQSLPQDCFEIIVVDNGSTDDTKTICDKHALNIANFRYLYEQTPGLHAGRHAGMIAACGGILVYADDDIRALPTWLSGICEAFIDPDVALVGGKNLPDFEIEPPDWVEWLWRERYGRRSCTLFSILDFGDLFQEISPFYIWGCNFSVRKSVLLAIGGFHPDGMPKDCIKYRGDGETAVSAAIYYSKYKSIYQPTAAVFHWVPKTRMNFEYIRERAFASGVSESFFLIRRSGELSRIDWFYMQLKFAKNKINDIKKGNTANKKRFFRAFSGGYRAGFEFHRNAVANDPELLAWVLQQRYY